MEFDFCRIPNDPIGYKFLTSFMMVFWKRFNSLSTAVIITA